MDFKYLIDKVCAADYGPGFVILAAVVLVLVVGMLCFTAYWAYDRFIEFEKWRIDRASKAANRQRDTTHSDPTR